MLDSTMLVDQNVVCRSNTDQRDHFPRILDVSLFLGIHQICIPTFPSDPPMQSDTLCVIQPTTIGVTLLLIIDSFKIQHSNHLAS